jgi:ribosomal-protein-alanine N-acetyltransferase
VTFELTTHRLRLRELTEADAADLFRIYHDPIVMRFMGPPPLTVDEERENIRRHRRQYYHRYGYGLWGTVLRANDVLIGRCGLLGTRINGRMETELSFLLDRGCWGRGYATEAARAILQVAAARFRRERLVAVIHPDNVASLRAVERLGFVYEHDVPYRDFGLVRLYAREGLTAAFPVDRPGTAA